MVIPKPSGPHIVGCADVMTKVLSLPKDLNSRFLVIEKDVNFGTFTRLYYPTEADSNAKFEEATILPNAEGSLYAESLLSLFKLKWLSRLGSYFFGSALQHSYIDAPLISQTEYSKETGQENKKFPLVLLSHGLVGFRHIYSSFCCELASHGYVVAAVEHRDGSALPSYFIHPETSEATPLPYIDLPTTESSDEETFLFRSQQVEKRAEEISKLLDLVEVMNKEPETIENLYPSNFDLTSLKERIDVNEPMIFGHSFGGATTLKAMNLDDRFKCGIVLDPWYLPLSTKEEFFDAGIKKPTFTIFTELFNWHKNVQRSERFNEGLPEDFGEVITLKNAVHWDQCDAPGFFPWFIKVFARLTGGIPPNHNYEKGIVLQRKIIMDYFGKYLQQKSYPIKLLDGYTVPSEFFKGARVFDKNNKKTDEKIDEDKKCNNTTNGIKRDETEDKHEEEKK